MSLTVVSFGAAVRVGGEYDADGRRGFILLATTPNPAQLSPAAARRVARTLQMFAERARQPNHERIAMTKTKRVTAFLVPKSKPKTMRVRVAITAPKPRKPPKVKFVLAPKPREPKRKIKFVLEPRPPR
jgi:hypothetical protein